MAQNTPFLPNIYTIGLQCREGCRICLLSYQLKVFKVMICKTRADHTGVFPLNHGWAILPYSSSGEPALNHPLLPLVLYDLGNRCTATLAMPVPVYAYSAHGLFPDTYEIAPDLQSDLFSRQIPGPRFWKSRIMNLKAYQQD